MESLDVLISWFNISIDGSTDGTWQLTNREDEGKSGASAQCCHAGHYRRWVDWGRACHYSNYWIIFTIYVAHMWNIHIRRTYWNIHFYSEGNYLYLGGQPVEIKITFKILKTDVFVICSSRESRPLLWNTSTEWNYLEGRVEFRWRFNCGLLGCYFVSYGDLIHLLLKAFQIGLQYHQYQKLLLDTILSQ